MCHRLYVVEDHTLMRETLCQFMDMQEGLTVVGDAGTAEDAFDAIGALPERPDLVLVDVSLPGMDGIALLRRLRERHDDLRCLMLSGHAEESYVRSARTEGASGYIVKGHPSVTLDAVRRVLDGGTFLSDDISQYWDKD